MSGNKETKLCPTTVLQRADDLNVSVGLHGNITVSIAEPSESRRRSACSPYRSRFPTSTWTATDGTSARSFDVSVPIEITHSGMLDGVALAFDATLASTLHMTD